MKKSVKLESETITEIKGAGNQNVCVVNTFYFINTDPLNTYLDCSKKGNYHALVFISVVYFSSFAIL